MQTGEWAAEKDELSRTVQRLADQKTADAARISMLAQNLAEVEAVVKSMVKSQVSLKMTGLQQHGTVCFA